MDKGEEGAIKKSEKEGGNELQSIVKLPDIS